MKLIIIILTILFIPLLVKARDITENTVYVDNLEIQQYQGHLGRWVKSLPSARFKAIVKEFGADDKAIKEHNPSYKSRSNSYVFVPFSDEYVAQIEQKEAWKRRVLESGKEDLIWPISVIDRISSLLGRRRGGFHPGVDLAAEPGTPIVAALDGKVVLSKYVDGYGNCVMLEHRNNFITKYGHCSVLLVRNGDYVKKGQLLALVGTTGRSTGPHLHFEIRLNDIPLDPLDFFPEDEQTAEVVQKVSKTLK